MINRTLYQLLLLGLMSMLIMPCSAQNNGNNERSKILENFKGKPYYIHFVKDGQTLYGIAKIYGVTSDVLIENNPDLKAGLKADMILRVPFIDTIVTKVNLKPAPIIKKKEVETVNQPAKTIGLIDYSLKRGETLYGIAKRYNVSMDEILNANPGVTSFRVGVKIHIPVIQREAALSTILSKSIKVAATNSKTVNVKTSDVKIPSNNTFFNDSPSKNPTDQFKVAMLIPFYLDEIDSIRVDQTQPRSFAFIQFYESALLAVDSIRKQGMDVKLFVYDSDGDEGIEKTRLIFQKKELADMDLIIGPFYAKSFEIASRYAGTHRIPIVNPLSKRNEILTAKPWVFKVQPGSSGQMAELSGFINHHFANANVVLVRSDRVKMTEESAAFKTEWSQLLKKENKTTYLKESYYTAEGITGLSMKLSVDKPNILIVLSGDEVFVSGLLRNLDAISSKYDLTVIGTAAWEDFKLDMNSMNHLKMHLYSNKYVDFSDQGVKKFSAKFQQEYKTLPQVKGYGFDGFDITYFFLSTLMKYGRQFGKPIEDYKYQGMLDSFHYHKLEGGGYDNTAINFYRFENNNLKRIQ